MQKLLKSLKFKDYAVGTEFAFNRVTTKLEVDMKKQESRLNLTGIPDAMKEKFECASGLSFDDVRVYYNSNKPAQLQALAYTYGNRVYIAQGQEKHLEHELMHVVQQKQGRVKATRYINGFPLNDDHEMEQEANAIDSIKHSNFQFNMGNKASRVIQRYCKIKEIIPQNGGNCGLYCIRMAIDALGRHRNDNDFYIAAEKSGSYVGEIFSFEIMKKIVIELGCKTIKREFNSEDTFIRAIEATGTNPVLIPYSAKYLYNIGPQDAAHTQTGHWSIIENLSGDNIKIANPWGREDTFDAKYLYEASKEMSSTPKKEKPVFNWDVFMGNNTTRQIMYAMGEDDSTIPAYVLTRVNNKIIVSRRAFTKGAFTAPDFRKEIQPVEQPLDLSGYIVEIRS